MNLYLRLLYVLWKLWGAAAQGSAGGVARRIPCPEELRIWAELGNVKRQNA